MKELVRSNDPVFVSWLTAALTDAGVDSLVLDQHTSVLEGSIGILPRRIMVLDEDLDRAQAVLQRGPDASIPVEEPLEENVADASSAPGPRAHNPASHNPATVKSG